MGDFCVKVNIVIMEVCNDLCLSIVIPAYNVERYIITCINSIIISGKGMNNSFEIIVVDDGSTDSTKRLVEEYISKNVNNNIFLISQKKGGVSAARNVGLKNCRGNFVWFVDGDDAIAEIAIPNILNMICLNYRSVDVLKIGNCISDVLFDNDDVLSNHVISCDSGQGYLLPAYELLDEKYDHIHCTYIWDRIFLLKNDLYYPWGIAHNEDFCFLVNSLLLAQSAYINLSFNFYFYRERANSVSRGSYNIKKKDKLVRDKFEVLDNLLQIAINSEYKQRYYMQYLNLYVYTIIADCLFRKYPFYLIVYSLRRLQVFHLYPMHFSLRKVSPFRIWLFNQYYLFVLLCYIYRWLTKKDKCQ